MADLSKPLLRLHLGQEQQRKPGKQNKQPRMGGYAFSDQKTKFGPQFDRLKSILDREDGELVLRSDPSSLAPERLMVFEVKGEVGNFVKALNKIDGILSLVDEEELPTEDEQIGCHLYLLVPDFVALKSIESLWRRWSNEEDLGTGFAPWRNLFALLHNIRLWGPEDRLREYDRELLEQEAVDKADNEEITIEIELVYRKQKSSSDQQQEKLSSLVRERGGSVVSACYIPDIHYHAILARFPAKEIKAIIEYMPDSIVGHDAVMHITPQSLATKITFAEDAAENFSDKKAKLFPSKQPIAALLDGVPIAGHTVLANRLVLDDQFGLEANALAKDRRHGTAMASLITRGDLNLQEEPLDRKIHVIPVLGKDDEFPADRLIIDLVYTAIMRMLDKDNPTAGDVLIVNVSLGNRRKVFDQRMSAWARLIDRLSYLYGLLFVVSAGNHTEPFAIQGVATQTEFEDMDPKLRATKTLNSVGAKIRNRRLLSPSESVNALTIGAANHDNVPIQERRSAFSLLNPYPDITMTNPSSALGPGFAQSVKPDLLFSGGREHLNALSSGDGLSVRIAAPARAHGLKVAGPPSSTSENAFGYSGCTSGATALASRACHQIHDALEAAYGAEFLTLPKKYRACLLKALLVHTASWPKETAEFIKEVIGPNNGRQHIRQKDNIRRFLGYGVANPELAVSCVSDRATFWAVGELSSEAAQEIEIPIPACIAAKPLPHYISATLAWITPVAAGRKSYRSVRLTLKEPEELDVLGVDPSKLQPDQNQGRKGTVFSRSWEGQKAPAFGDNHTQKFWIQREPDQGDVIDDPVSFGIAITLSMPNVQEIYDQVRARLRPASKVAAR